MAASTSTKLTKPFRRVVCRHTEIELTWLIQQQRHIHELTLNARINWEVPWAQIPAQDKVSLYQVVRIYQVMVRHGADNLEIPKARERHPILGQYVNDWATEELVKQYIKNKRKHAYAKRYIDVPDKYNYLKHNASKRSTAPRASRAKFGTVTSSAGRG